MYSDVRSAGHVVSCFSYGKIRLGRLFCVTGWYIENGMLSDCRRRSSDSCFNFVDQDSQMHISQEMCTQVEQDGSVYGPCEWIPFYDLT